MLLDAAVLASLLGVSAIFLFKKFPKPVKKFLLDHILITDALLLVMTFGAFGTTATALMAGAMLDVIVGGAAYIASHPDDFMYLFDMKDAMMNWLGRAKDYANELGLKYRESNLADQIEREKAALASA